MTREANYRMRTVWLGGVAAIPVISTLAKGDFTFLAPIELGPPIWSPGDTLYGSCFSGDGLELYFASDRPGGFGGGDIWVAKREALNSPWQEPVNLGPAVNSSTSETEPAISSDGLELYLRWDSESYLRVCKRQSRDALWSSPALVGPPASYDAWGPDISADGLSLYFASTRAGGYGADDIWVATRATRDAPRGEPVNLGPTVNSPNLDVYPSISSDGRVLFFTSTRTGNYNAVDIWVTKRATEGDSWSQAVMCDTININDTGKSFVGWRFEPAISPDGSVLYFQIGHLDIWQSAIVRIVDFNGDSFVEISDLVMLIDNWGTDRTVCDIGPFAWGDGVVDAADLRVLMSYWGQEVNDPTLIAHWRLDESNGNVAYDSAIGCDGAVSGDPVWQPAGGHAHGALRCDGVDDYVSTPFVLNPDGGPYSVLAWIQGGAPGQVILSQKDGANWLMAATPSGGLTTELKNQRSGALASPAIITDGTWHRVGFVRDGSDRILYVDGVEVARDAQSGLAGSKGGLYIGAGKGLEPGSFWSGLIDDVRIYNRAVEP